MMIIDGTLPATLACLQAIPDPGQRLAAFTGAIIAQGGTILLPPDGDTWGPLLVEFSFKGIFGTGTTAEEAMADWMICAARVVAAESALFAPDTSAADLRNACLMVRTRSENPAAIEQGRRVERALQLGMQ